MKKATLGLLSVIFALSLLSVTSCKKTQKTELTILAAASLTDVCAELKTAYEEENKECPEQDSNLHASRHTHLKRARLPIPPPGQLY